MCSGVCDGCVCTCLTSVCVHRIPETQPARWPLLHVTLSFKPMGLSVAIWTWYYIPVNEIRTHTGLHMDHITSEVISVYLWPLPCSQEQLKTYMVCCEVCWEAHVFCLPCKWSMHGHLACMQCVWVYTYTCSSSCLPACIIIYNGSVHMHWMLLYVMNIIVKCPSQLYVYSWMEYTCAYYYTHCIYWPTYCVIWLWRNLMYTVAHKVQYVHIHKMYPIASCRCLGRHPCSQCAL